MSTSALDDYRTVPGHPLELELQAVVRHPAVGAGNQTQTLCKNGTCSELSHVPSS